MTAKKMTKTVGLLSFEIQFFVYKSQTMSVISDTTSFVLYAITSAILKKICFSTFHSPFRIIFLSFLLYLKFFLKSNFCRIYRKIKKQVLRQMSLRPAF